MEEALRSADFWDGVTEVVTAKVEPVVGASPHSRDPVIAYLRDLEVVARQECPSREAVQVIASARRVLGDMTEIARGDGPFSHT